MEIEYTHPVTKMRYVYRNGYYFFKSSRGIWEKSGLYKGFTVIDTSTTPYKGIKMSDQVKNPKHYQLIEGVEAIEIIASSMSVEGFKCYCLGNTLKYRLRAGKKDNAEQDLAKADFYSTLFGKYKHLCRDSK